MKMPRPTNDVQEMVRMMMCANLLEGGSFWKNHHQISSHRIFNFCFTGSKRSRTLFIANKLPSISLRAIRAADEDHISSPIATSWRSITMSIFNLVAVKSLEMLFRWLPIPSTMLLLYSFLSISCSMLKGSVNISHAGWLTRKDYLQIERVRLPVVSEIEEHLSAHPGIWHPQDSQILIAERCQGLVRQSPLPGRTTAIRKWNMVEIQLPLTWTWAANPRFPRRIPIRPAPNDHTWMSPGAGNTAGQYWHPGAAFPSQKSREREICDYHQQRQQLITQISCATGFCWSETASEHLIRIRSRRPANQLPPIVCPSFNSIPNSRIRF